MAARFGPGRMDEARRAGRHRAPGVQVRVLPGPPTPALVAWQSLPIVVPRIRRQRARA